MEKTFGIDDSIIANALKKGICLMNQNVLTKATGFIALTYIPQMDEFIITYGLDQTSSGYVFVKDYKKTWDVK